MTIYKNRANFSVSRNPPLLAAGASAATQTPTNPETFDGQAAWSNLVSRRGGVSTIAHPIPSSTGNVWTLEPGADRPEPLLMGPDNEGEPAFSPAGDLLAYTSDRTGRSEVYVMSYPAAAGGAPWPVSEDGGTTPRWSPDGRTIWFRNADKIFAAELIDGPELRTSDPVVLFEGIDDQWDIAGDGSFVVTRDGREPPSLRMVLNWFEDLRAKTASSRSPGVARMPSSGLRAGAFIRNRKDALR